MSLKPIGERMRVHVDGAPLDVVTYVDMNFLSADVMPDILFCVTYPLGTKVDGKRIVPDYLSVVVDGEVIDRIRCAVYMKADGTVLTQYPMSIWQSVDEATNSINLVTSPDVVESVYDVARRAVSDVAAGEALKSIRHEALRYCLDFVNDSLEEVEPRVTHLQKQRQRLNQSLFLLGTDLDIARDVW